MLLSSGIAAGESSLSEFAPDSLLPWEGVSHPKCPPSEVRRFRGVQVPIFQGEFWTSKQRQGHSVHEISYRACYKPQLPAFFIRRFCEAGDAVYDPFMGRGTTLIEAQLHGCRAFGNDANPLSQVLVAPRLSPPTLPQIMARLCQVELSYSGAMDDGLLVFFHSDTLRELYAWRHYFERRKAQQAYDRTDAWLEMVACNRLTGHSPGFFSVYTLPPNQAASIESQRRINERKQQSPDYRDTKALILRKSRQLLRDPFPRGFHRDDCFLCCESSDQTPGIPSESAKLIVTSPPFLDNVDYLKDNWLRMWFCGIEVATKAIWQLRSLSDWLAKMKATFMELRRILRPDGAIAFEVGEVRKGSVSLENEVAMVAMDARLQPECIIINSQCFTKTSNCWGVANNSGGTNSNRIVVLRREV